MPAFIYTRTLLATRNLARQEETTMAAYLINPPSQASLPNPVRAPSVLGTDAFHRRDCQKKKKPFKHPKSLTTSAVNSRKKPRTPQYRARKSHTQQRSHASHDCLRSHRGQAPIHPAKVHQGRGPHVVGAPGAFLPRRQVLPIPQCHP